MTLRYDVLFVLGLTGMMSACSGVSARRASVQVDRDATIIFDTKTTRQVKRGESFVLQDAASVLVESPGTLPVLLVPLRSETVEARVHMRPIFDEHNVTDSLWESVDGLIGEIEQIEILLREKKAKEALTMVNELSEKYPRLSRLRLLKASCLYVLGDREGAKGILDTVHNLEKP